jgi:hypothetical protein
MQELGVHKLPPGWSRTAYLDYIESWKVGRYSLSDYLTLFLDMVRFFKKTPPHECEQPRMIQSYMDLLSASPASDFYNNTKPNSERRRELVKERVLFMLGIWTAMLSYFVPQPRYRPIEQAYCYAKGVRLNSDENDAFKRTLPELLEQSGLIPSRHAFEEASWEHEASTGRAHQNIIATIGDLEAACISRTELNAYTISKLTGVSINWTMNMSRHLLLSKQSGRPVLEIFALPCILRSDYPAGIDTKFMQEIENSYGTLFQPYGVNKHEQGWNKVLRRASWCWCRACLASRLRVETLRDLKDKICCRSQDCQNGRASKGSEALDSTLEIQMCQNARNWDLAHFPCLWPRILALQAFQQEAKPWGFWVLFRDRRDTLQFWTFL